MQLHGLMRFPGMHCHTCHGLVTLERSCMHWGAWRSHLLMRLSHCGVIVMGLCTSCTACKRMSSRSLVPAWFGTPAAFAHAINKEDKQILCMASQNVCLRVVSLCTATIKQAKDLPSRQSCRSRWHVPQMVKRIFASVSGPSGFKEKLCVPQAHQPPASSPTATAQPGATSYTLKLLGDGTVRSPRDGSPGAAHHPAAGDRFCPCRL